MEYRSQHTDRVCACFKQITTVEIQNSFVRFSAAPPKPIRLKGDSKLLSVSGRNI